MICINAEALNVLMESTLAVIATRNLHYSSEIEALFRISITFPNDDETRKVKVFRSVICGNTQDDDASPQQAIK